MSSLTFSQSTLLASVTAPEDDDKDFHSTLAEDNDEDDRLASVNDEDDLLASVKAPEDDDKDVHSTSEDNDEDDDDEGDSKSLETFETVQSFRSTVDSSFLKIVPDCPNCKRSGNQELSFVIEGKESCQGPKCRRKKAPKHAHVCKTCGFTLCLNCSQNEEIQ